MSISALRRIYITQELEKKITAWSSTEVRNNYVVNPSNPMFPQFGIERDENGFYYMSDRIYYYCDLRNGMNYRIKKNFKEIDFTCYQELYEAGISSGKFLIRKPTYREEIVLADIKWEYVELASPNNQYGTNFNNEVIKSWPKIIDGVKTDNTVSLEFKQKLAGYFQESFDDFLDVYSAAKVIAEKHGRGLPAGICEITNLYRDKAGIFWSDFDYEDWNFTVSDIKFTSMEQFHNYLTFAKSLGALDENHVIESLEYARVKWTMI